MTRAVSAPATIPPVSVRARAARPSLGRVGRIVTSLAPLIGLVGASAYVLTTQATFIVAETYGYYWRP
jgi:hypothetical protein